MSTTSTLEAANAEYAATFTKGTLPLPPKRKVAIVACMDARIDVFSALGLTEGDAHVIRNAGGRAVEALRSLVISQRLLGTREVVIIHHTDCGMLTFTDEEIQTKIRDELGQEVAGMAFLPFRDVEGSVREDVAVVKECPLVIGEVYGYVYQVETGRIVRVSP